VTIALLNNRLLRVAELDLETANKQVKEAYGALFPTVDGTASLQRNLKLPTTFLPAVFIDPEADPGEVVPITFGADNEWSAGLTLEQKVFDAGVFIGVGAAGKFRDLNKESVRRTAQRVATNIRITYLNVLLAHEQVRVTENSIQRVERTLAETRALNRAGLASDYDVLRLEVQLSNIQPNLRRSRNELVEAERVLAIEMGLDEVESVSAEGQLHLIDLAQPADNTEANRSLLDFIGYAGAEEATLDELFAVALERRADLREARVQRELEDVQVKVARTELFPRLNLFLNWFLFAQENGALNFYGDNPDQRATTAAVGVSLEVPIFAGGSRWNRVEQRKIARRQVEEQIVDLTQRAENEVRTVYEQLTESRARAEAQKAAVGQAGRGFDIATTEYLAGTAPRLEVTEAELALRQAEVNYAVAVYDYLVAQARLDLAVGTVPMVETYFGVDESQAWAEDLAAPAEAEERRGD
jgi:outer membrane protein TolC